MLEKGWCERLKEKLKKLSRAARRRREGQCCLSPGEKEVYWQPQNEWVYFLPILSKNLASVTLTSLATKCLRHFFLPFKSFKTTAVKAALAHKSGCAPHVLLCFFIFPLKAPKFISFVASWKLWNALLDTKALGQQTWRLLLQGRTLFSKPGCQFLGVSQIPGADITIPIVHQHLRLLLSGLQPSAQPLIQSYRAASKYITG